MVHLPSFPLRPLAYAAAWASLVASSLVTAQTSRSLPTPDPENGGITLPQGFAAVVFADSVGAARFLTVGPTGDVYVKTRNGGIVALRDTDGDGKSDQQEKFGEGGGTGIALRGEWLYHSTDSHVLRYRLTPGSLAPTGEPEVVVKDLPNARQHAAKSFAFGGDGQLYVEVGSPSNALGNPDRARGAKARPDAEVQEFLSKHGGFWRFDPDKLNQTQADGHHFSTGHRHVLSIAWHPTARSFFMVQHGRDQLNTVAPDFYTAEDNAELPAEELHQLKEGADFGWPRTYFDPRRKQRMLAPEYGGDGKTAAPAGKHPDPLVAFPAHWAPMQMAVYAAEQFPAKYRGGAFVAFHGSWNRAPLPQRGYNVAFVPFDESGRPTGQYEVFADGFAGTQELMSTARAQYRPCGVAVGPDGSLYVADSTKGRVWRIFYTGQ